MKGLGQNRPAILVGGIGLGFIAYSLILLPLPVTLFIIGAFCVVLAGGWAILQGRHAEPPASAAQQPAERPEEPSAVALAPASYPVETPLEEAGAAPWAPPLPEEAPQEQDQPFPAGEQEPEPSPLLQPPGEEVAPAAQPAPDEGHAASLKRGGRGRLRPLRALVTTYQEGEITRKAEAQIRLGGHQVRRRR